MVDEKSLLSQCIDLANQVIKKNAMASISIKIGEGFSFDFDNHEVKEKKSKKKSPSQDKRDVARSVNFRKNTLKCETNEVKENLETKIENKSIDVTESKENEIDQEEEVFCEKVFVVPKRKIENHNIGF